MRILISTVQPDREVELQYLLNRLPKAEVIYDTKRDSVDTFERMLESAGEDPIIALEDDIVLADNFLEKIIKVINEYPNDLINFFSIYPSYEDGVKKRSGGTFSFNQCIYYPKGLAKDILEFSRTWEGYKYKAGYDKMIAYFLDERGIDYLIYTPSLVQHRTIPSIIDPSQSDRVSPTFRKDIKIENI